MNLFKRINEEKNITFLQVTHSPETADYGNRVIRLDSGMMLGALFLKAVLNTKSLIAHQPLLRLQSALL